MVRDGRTSWLELSFVISAIRRRLWLVAVFAILGALAGYSLRDSGPDVYEANAILLVQPPESPLGGVNFISDPDRYVTGQLSVLRSLELADDVASEFGDEDSFDLAGRVRVVHRAKTDIVDVFVRSANPERARDLANAWVTKYLEKLRTQANSAVETELATVADRLAELQSQLEDAKRTVAENTIIDQVPGGGAVLRVKPEAAAAEAEVVVLESEIARTSDNKSQLELVAQLKVTSEIVQEAVTPRAALAKTGSMLVLLGLIAGALLGVVAAVLTARFSPLVLDQVHAATILGHPVVGTLRRHKGLHQEREAALTHVPTDAVAVIDQLCVRAEANSTVGQSLTVAVVGTQRGAGATTVALAMAGRFASRGTSVALVDADQQQPDLSHTFPGPPQGGIPALLSRLRRERTDDDLGSTTGRRRKERGEEFATTPVPEVRVLGLGSSLEAAVLRRTDVPTLLTGVVKEAEVVILDGGPILDAASTVQLCQQVDAVVLAVPINRQRIAELEVVARQLQGGRGELLPVGNMPYSRGRSSATRHRQAPTFAADTVDDGVPVDA
jgi:capsular polysaccharide biosynthesis protein